jgi:hypothetical protein
MLSSILLIVQANKDSITNIIHLVIVGIVLWRFRSLLKNLLNDFNKK